MIDDIERLAKVLGTPGLDEETVKQINEAIREKLAEYRKQSVQPPEPSAADQLTPSVFAEWFGGPQSAGTPPEGG